MQFVPSLTRNQWIWLGGATALGVAEVVSAPIALALAALPVLDSLANEDGRSSRSNGTASRTRSSRAGNGRRRTRATARARGGRSTRRRTGTETTA